MGDIEKAKMGREARDTVGNQRPTTGENDAQAALRRYLGAVIFRSRDKHKGRTEER
jgi:hypothetical protein